MAYQYKIDDTEGGLTLLTDLGIRGAPHSGYRPYATTIKLGDGTQKGQGFPIITWNWGFLSVAERGIFIAMVAAGALSAPVFIRTRLPNNVFYTFQCTMNIPSGEENLSVGKIIGFDLVFTDCVLIPDP